MDLPPDANNPVDDYVPTDEELGRAPHRYYRFSVALLFVPIALWALGFAGAASLSGMGAAIVAFVALSLLSFIACINAFVASVRAARSSQPPGLALVVAGVCGVVIASMFAVLMWVVAQF